MILKERQGGENQPDTFESMLVRCDRAHYLHLLKPAMMKDQEV